MKVHLNRIHSDLENITSNISNSLLNEDIVKVYNYNYSFLFIFNNI